jgi:apolipoprotein N-acyltransferase
MVRDHYLRLSTLPGVETRTHILWAESALPIYLLDEPRTLDVIARTIGDGRVLMTGLRRRDLSTPLQPRYYNSFAAISIENATPIPSALYDKVKLVPFGEYTPFEGVVDRLVPTLQTFTDGFTHGPGKATVPIPGAPAAAPQICYEIVFPGFTPRGVDRPGWIVNVTNDSWYQGTPGPEQLFNQARYRAIEEGMPLARAASGGTSALVDSYGRAVGLLPPEADDVIDGNLPLALPPTLYSMLGDAPVYLMALAGLFVGLARRRASR